MQKNAELINRGFSTLLPVLADFVAQEFSREYGDRWWIEARETLGEQAKDVPEDGDYADLVDSLNIANCLRLLDRKWNKFFKKRLPHNYRSWANELRVIHNKMADATTEDIDDTHAWRALDTMALLCDALDDETAEKIRELERVALYGSADGSTATTSASADPVAAPITTNTISKTSGLPSWRTIIEPHPDVAEGRYRNAEFAANLAQVARGKGAPEYYDPVEFFARTYLTEGMKDLLVQALKRVTDQGGEPVIQLKTAFGGGKTHSMLALYHLMRNKVPVSKMAGVEEVLQEAGVTEIPKVNVVVLVGTALDPSKSRHPQNLPGVTVNTLWGEMAAQLAIATGRPELYEYVREADRHHVSPGSEALTQLFDACGPCMILIDELVAYARVLYGGSDLPAGTYGNLLSFVQAITEAASNSTNSLVVASIPESDIEIGGDAGKEALTAIEHTFGRMEAIWKPVGANEGFEVVRRRLFLDCKDPDARDEVCERFSQMYQTSSGDFPLDTREIEYRNRLISCYPIHPEIFDQLYGEWSTLENFQRTRGVLRLMAAVIHELWMAADANPMIMPGSLPLNVPAVRDELIRDLPDEWNGIVDTEVDGKNSVPYLIDKNNSRFGALTACRRLSRTIFLGSAPADRSQSGRGIEVSRIRLGVTQPGENIPVYDDALRTLQNNLSYLYSSPNNDRYWYDTHPTLRKIAEDRASQVANADVEHEIEKRLTGWRRGNDFAGIHIYSGNTQDIPDEKAVRLVILGPDDTYISGVEENDAITACEDLIANRGISPRTYRNTLVFLAPDGTIQQVKQEVRRLLAWQSIQEDSTQLNLDASQNREVKKSVDRANENVDLRLKEAYCWLIVPRIDSDEDIKTILWDEEDIRGGLEMPVANAQKRLEDDDALIPKCAPAYLLMQLDNLLWRDSDDIQINKLWEMLCSYCYLPRLTSYDVLKRCILDGVNSDEYFAYAEGKNDQRYIGLKYNSSLPVIDEHGYLVKLPIALKQLLEEQKTEEQKDDVPSINYTDSSQNDDETNTTTTFGTIPTSTQQDTDLASNRPKNTRFYLSTPLNITRINRDVPQLVDEVINQLYNVTGAKVKITLEVDAELPNGIPADIVRSVNENCNTLKVDQFGFED